MQGTSKIERFFESIRLLPKLNSTTNQDQEQNIPKMNEPGKLTDYPKPEEWNHWQEYDAKAWPQKVKKSYQIVPTICFNCEAGCGLLAYVDKDTNEVRKFEGNPYHPGSRGKNCAKGPATINQIEDEDRILYPMKRTGKRGDGKWERITWDQALNEISTKIRKTIKAEKLNEVVYHVGRPGHEGYIERVLKAWGVDGHNSHTNICSAGARLGYALWDGFDRPSADFANAEVILLISAHLEAGHYFNPHAQRIIEGKKRGAKLLVMDTRLSNTASRADMWMPTYPGTEAAVLLAMAKIILQEKLYNKAYIEKWVNWKEYLEVKEIKENTSVDTFIEQLILDYQEFTPEYAEKESGIAAKDIIEAARLVGNAGSRFSCHNWRSAGSGNKGGWAVARCLQLLNVLTGSIGTKGGVSPNEWNKFHPTVYNQPPPVDSWNELHFPDEYPLSHFELSYLLPHFLKEKRGKLSCYFTRVFNPVWTYPDGFSWIEALSDEEKVEMHIALTPTWNETAYYADYVLPMGHASERHDLVSYETHSGVWIGFRQPVMREIARRNNQKFEFTYEVNPGEVWEEDEFWIELSWRIDPDGSMGIQKYFESPYREGEKINIDEYYRYIFEHVDGLKEKAAEENLSELEYMRKYGAFPVSDNLYKLNEIKLDSSILNGATIDKKTNVIQKDGASVGVVVDEAVKGFNSPSRLQEFYSSTMKDWKWNEHTIPGYIKSHIHWENMDYDKGEFPLVPTYRLPNLIHSRSGNSKWLNEIANRNPLWMHPSDAKRLGFENNTLVRVNTEIGYFVIRIWSTEAIRPGTVCCSHHIGRWKREQDPVNNRWVMNTVDIQEIAPGQWKLKKKKGIQRSEGKDPDLKRIFWEDGGVHQNITFPVHPDPVSGMHCWHQKVRIEKAHKGDEYGDIFVDTNKSMDVYRKWLAETRPAPGPGGLRRPLWLKRPMKPKKEQYYKK